MQIYNITTINQHPKHDEWAAFVQRHPYGSPFQHPDCYALFNTFGKLRPKFTLHYDNDDMINGVLMTYPCSFFPSFPKIPYAHIAINGPIVDPSYSNNMIDEIRESMVLGFSAMKNLHSPIIELRILRGKSIKQTVYRTSSNHLNLRKDIRTYEKLTAQITKAKLRCIKKIAREGFHTAPTENAADLNDFLFLLRKHYKRIRKPSIDPKVIEGIAWTTMKQNSFRVLVTKKGNKVCGGTILGFCRDTCYEWYIASDRTIKNSGTAVTFGAIEYAMKAGYTKFDFMGIGKPNVPYGVREFKMDFGGEVERYMRYRL